MHMAEPETNKHYLVNKAPLARKSLVRLPFGSIEPRGWLRRQMEIQGDGMTRHLLDEATFDRYLEPCKSCASEVTYQRGVYQEGVITLGWTMHDEVFLKRAKEAIEKTLAEDPTYLGTTRPEQDAVIYIRSRQMRAFVEHYEVTRDERIIAWLTRLFEAWGKFTDEISWWPVSATTDLFDVGFWLYNHTGNPAVLDAVRGKSGFAEKVTDSFLHFPEKEYEKHNVVVAWISKAPAALHQLDPGEPRYRNAVFEGIARRDQWFGQIAGRYTGHEHYTKKLEDGRRPTNGTELCGVVEYMFSMEKLLEIFGDVSLADRLELLAYNSLPGTCTPDFFAHQYDQQANQVNVSIAPRGFDNSDAANVYGFAPHYPCCTYNMHHAWPRLTAHLWMATHDQGLAVVVYAPCRVTAKVADGQSVTITETTDYPFDGTVRFKVDAEKPVKFALHLRIPSWADGAEVSCGGKRTACGAAGTLFRLERTWQPGDECVLTLPMRVRTEKRFNDSIAVMRGPLYFSLRIGQDFRDIREGRDWEILPTTPWNYGLEITSETAEARTQVVRNEIGEYPFAQHGEPLYRKGKDAVVGADGQITSYVRETYGGKEPVILKVRGRLIPNWGMDETYPANAADPPKSPVASSQSETELELIPYGCTRLRISEFPWFQG
jgi:uncharacterized protein